MLCKESLGLARVLAGRRFAGNRVWGRVGEGEGGDIELEGSHDDTLTYTRLELITQLPLY